MRILRQRIHNQDGIFKGLIEYAWALEQGTEKGYHCHLLLVYKGHEHKNAYGIAAAAKIYYNKNLDELTTAQMAMISGLPKAPSKYNPVANPKRALERRNWILGRMLQLGYINQAEYQKAIAEPVSLDMPERGVNNRFPYVGEMVRSELVQTLGEQAVDSGYKVYTTINSKRQAYAEEAVQNGLEDYDRRHGWRGAEAHDEPLSGFMAYANTFPQK